MGAHDVFRILAVLFAFGTTALLVATKTVRNGWLPWLAIPVVAFIWYWLLVSLYLTYYAWRVGGVR